MKVSDFTLAMDSTECEQPIGEIFDMLQQVQIQGNDPND